MVDERVIENSVDIGRLSAKMSVMEQTLLSINEKLSTIALAYTEEKTKLYSRADNTDRRFDVIETKFTSVECKLESTEKKLDATQKLLNDRKLETRLNKKTITEIGAIAGTIVTIVVTALKLL